MIRPASLLAVIFDLDGTLVLTERLKAISYARAAVELCPCTLSPEEVLEVHKEVVGLPRRSVASALVERFGLEAKAEARMEESGVTSARQAFVSVRLGYYEEMILDPEVLRRNRWPHNLELLRIARETGCRVGLATMSGRDRTRQALEALDLTDAFDVVATRDDVQQGKPDPEIYRLVSRVLGLPAERTLVVEDSPSGVEAALAAGMHCLAVTTPFTRERMHAQGLLEDPWIVDDAATLPDVVRRMIEASE